MVSGSNDCQRVLAPQPHAQQLLDVFEERLHHDTRSDVLAQVAFRLDFPAWMRTRTERDRRIIRDMIRDERTMDLARKYGLSPSRISQLRCDYQADWERFCSDRADSAESVPA
jgi:hypothetical protein